MMDEEYVCISAGDAARHSPTPTTTRLPALRAISPDQHFPTVGEQSVSTRLVNYPSPIRAPQLNHLVTTKITKWLGLRALVT